MSAHLVCVPCARSTALRGNDMWENTIGVEFDQAGSNAAIEASIYAPTHGGGGGRSQRRELAQQLIKTSESMHRTNCCNTTRACM